MTTAICPKLARWCFYRPTRHHWLRKRINYNVVAPFFFKTVPQGAATTVLCATAPLEELAPGEYHDNCAPKAAALATVLEYCAEKGAPNVVDDCWNTTEALLKELGF